jgi:sporulation protein YlmC with PRC-barrel domain
MVKVLINTHDLKGKDVYGKRGVKIGQVEDVELDNNWQVKALDVKMNEDVGKIYGEKAGFMKKQIISLPANLLGPMTADNVTLKEEITDFDALRGNIRKESAF